jgi:integrase
MPFDDVPAFLAELRGDLSLPSLGLQFTILTAARAGEVIGNLREGNPGVRWQEIDLEARTWTVPANRMKTREMHRVPLSDAAMAVLTAVPRNGDRVFPVSDSMMWLLLKRKGLSYTVHGFRSSFRDWVDTETSFPGDLAERSLAHKTGNAVERSYRRNDALDKRRQLMDAWGDFCCPPDHGDNVLAFPGAVA